MTIDDLKDGKNGVKLIFETLAGSHAYGTNTPKSDRDIRGIFVHPPDAYLGLTTPAEQIQNDKQDIVYYSLHKFFQLAKDCNPNIVELLWMPDDCITVKTPEMEDLMYDRSMFISKRCFYTFSGYAHAQIKKAKGQEKMVHHKAPVDKPKKEDFCYIIDTLYRVIQGRTYKFPQRPVRINERECVPDLRQYHAAQLERTNNIFRLYFYGKEAKGVFRGDDMVVCENIPIEDEVSHFSYLMLYSKSEFEAAVRDWHRYWNWKNNRNEERWVVQEAEEKVELRWDRKNMQHCMRLLLSSEHILNHGSPIVRFEGEQLQFLRDIREGKFEYEEIMSDVERRMEGLKLSYEQSDAVPDKVDIKRIERLYREINRRAFP